MTTTDTTTNEAKRAWLNAAVAPEARPASLTPKEVAELDQELVAAGGDRALLVAAGGEEAVAEWYGAAAHGYLCRYEDAERIRPATAAEQAESVAAAKRDGGAGVIRVDGVRCYVED